MQHDESEDEFGFWEPAARHRLGRRRTDVHDTGTHHTGTHHTGTNHTGSSTGSSTGTGGEPTRQLRRIETGAGRDHSGELRRWRVTVAPEPAASDLPQRTGKIPAAGCSPADEARYLDSDLSDEHYFDADIVAVVAGDGKGGRARRTWRTLLVRDGRGRLDPLLTRLSAIAGVGVLLLVLSVATNGAGASPSGSTAATPSAIVPVVPASADSMLGASAAAPGTPATQAVTGSPAATVGDETTPPAAATAAPSTAAAAVAPAGTPSVSHAVNGTDASKASLAAATTPAPTPACGPAYTIAAGDYWIGIAGRADVPLSVLLDANAAQPGTALYPGRTICLPAGSAPLAPATKLTTTTIATTAPATTPPATVPATTTRPTTPPVTVPPATSPPPPTRPTAPATTMPPTTMPPTTTPKRTYTRAEVEQIIRDTWLDDQEDKAVAIATRESNLVPGVRNYCCYGLFQIYYDVHRSWLNQMGITSADQLFDPAVNARAALALYNRSGGWGPWAL